MIAFGSVIYNKAKEYLPDFFASLSRQTCKDFLLLLLNDGIKKEDLDQYLESYPGKIRIVTADDGKSPAELRLDLIMLAKEMNIELLVLGDCDDVFSDNRIQKLESLYKGNPDFSFYYNTIVTLDKTEELQELPPEIHDFRGIGESNFLGLSNTALNLEKIVYPYRYHFEGEIFDWYFFSRLLLDGLTGLFAEGCCTYYRIHGENIAGIADNNRADIEKEVQVKRFHYDHLMKYDDYYRKLSELYHHNGWIIRKKEGKGFLWWNLTSSSYGTEER